MRRPVSRCALVGLALVVTATRVTAADPPAPDPDPAVAGAIAVQSAMSLARTHLQAGRAKDAVAVLEGQLFRIDGNTRYLALLRDAYAAYLQDLESKNDADNARVIRARLKHLDPTAVSSSAPAAPPAPAAPAPAPPPATAETLPAEPVPAAPPAPPSAPVAFPASSVKARGKVADEPAEDTAGRDKARKAVTAADAAFNAAEYARAAALYDEAVRLDAASVAECGERRGYCKLFALVQAINRNELAGRTTADLEAEVRAAVALSPRLTEYGNTVLAHVREYHRGTEAKPGGRTSDGWDVIETANTRVLHHGAAELAGQVARAAEEARGKAFATWQGTAPPAWSPRCDIVLHASAAAYAQATGKPTASVGHSTMSANKTTHQIVGRRIDVRADDVNLLPNTLPHEMTHIVVADLFGDQEPPRWADEGMAVLAESRPAIDRYLKTLPRCRREGTLAPLSQFLESSDYPAAERITGFYVQSVSVVDYLVSLKGAPAFAMFVRHAPRYGFEQALEKHYGIKGSADLQARWERHALGPAMARGTP
jgi:tetratricopeptide (TPR) repeat protein